MAREGYALERGDVRDGVVEVADVKGMGESFWWWESEK